MVTEITVNQQGEVFQEMRQSPDDARHSLMKTFTTRTIPRIALVAATALPATVFGQDLNLKGETRYGTVTLEAGFAFDPWAVPVIAGGTHAVTE